MNVFNKIKVKSSTKVRNILLGLSSMLCTYVLHTLREEKVERV